MDASAEKGGGPETRTEEDTEDAMIPLVYLAFLCGILVGAVLMSKPKGWVVLGQGPLADAVRAQIAADPDRYLPETWWGGG